MEDDRSEKKAAPAPLPKSAVTMILTYHFRNMILIVGVIIDSCMHLKVINTGVQLDPCHDEFRGPGSDTVEIKWHKKQQQHQGDMATDSLMMLWARVIVPLKYPT
ncbi:hypothetical protein TNCV_3729711 [Trichonephila clavipes]|nr:hypothetical protein TNCV_3729711 [Trichonephila clavipes]